MIHDLDLMLALVDSPIEAWMRSAPPSPAPFEDIANARLRFDNGASPPSPPAGFPRTERRMRHLRPGCYMAADFAARS